MLTARADGMRGLALVAFASAIAGCAIALWDRTPYVAATVGLMVAAIVVGATVVWPRASFLGLGAFLLVQGWVATALERGTVVGEALSRADDVAIVLIGVVVLTQAMASPRGVRAPLWPLAAAFGAVGLAGALIGGGLSFANVLGAYLALKIWILFVIAVNLEWDSFDERFLRVVIGVGLAVSALAVVEFAFPSLVHGLLNVPILQGSRLGFTPAQAIFIHPGVLGWFLAYCAVFAIAWYLVGGPNVLGVAAFVMATAAMLSLRLKPIIGLGAASALGVLLVPRREKLLRWVSVPLIVSLVVITVGSIAFDVIGLQFSSYLGQGAQTNNARSVLYGASVEIAEDHAPLGTGLGTFGTWPSRIYYSPVYVEYGLSGVWGLSRENPDFIMDTFWPAVLGETGVLGAALYALLLLGLAWAPYRLLRVDSVSIAAHAVALGALLALFEAAVESLGSPVFFQQPSAYLLALPAAISWVTLKWVEQ